MCVCLFVCIHICVCLYVCIDKYMYLRTCIEENKEAVRYMQSVVSHAALAMIG